MDPSEKLPPEFYLRDTVTVARDLLGRYLVRQSPQGPTVCRITETEAYCGAADKACHSYSRPAPQGRTHAMYGPGGLAYIYLIYGMHHCFNVVTRPQGIPEAVLIRSAEPVEGEALMALRRGVSSPQQLLTGPGKLCQAMDIHRGLYGEALWGDTLYLTRGRPPGEEEIVATPRINIAYAQEAAEFPWRFLDSSSPCLSQRPKKTPPPRP